MTTAVDLPAGRRINIATIARAAGVSTATVDRVLNQRGGVRQPTLDRVIAAAMELGYRLPQDLRSDVRPPPMRLACVLPVGRNRYLEALANTIEQSSAELDQHNVRCRVDLIAGFNPKALAERLLQLQSHHDG